ncbi:MAG: toprim domain-containing protein [Leptospirales bacterium]
MPKEKAAPEDRPHSTLSDILSRLDGVRKSGSGWTAKCPTHEDRNSSLSIKITEEGRLLVHCFAGCSFNEIREALGLVGERIQASPQRKEEGPTPEQLAAQKKAVRIWKGAKPADPLHPYLTRKEILSHHSRQIGDSILIPMQDSSGDLLNIQFIHPDGTKRFLRGGRTKNLFTVIGEPSESGRIYIAEGFATAATVHELTGKSVFVAFSASNLPSVALTVRRAFPSAEIILCADADQSGERYSEEAAQAVNGLIAYAGKGI